MIIDVDVVATQGAHLLPAINTPAPLARPQPSVSFHHDLCSRLSKVQEQQFVRRDMYGADADESRIGDTPPDVRQQHHSELHDARRQYMSLLEAATPCTPHSPNSPNSSSPAPASPPTTVSPPSPPKPPRPNPHMTARVAFTSTERKRKRDDHDDDDAEHAPLQPVEPPRRNPGTTIRLASINDKQIQHHLHRVAQRRSKRKRMLPSSVLSFAPFSLPVT